MPSKDLTTLKSKDLLSYFRELNKRMFGDAVENDAAVYATSGGNYRVSFDVAEQGFDFYFKKKPANRIAKAIRALK